MPKAWTRTSASPCPRTPAASAAPAAPSCLSAAPAARRTVTSSSERRSWVIWCAYAMATSPMPTKAAIAAPRTSGTTEPKCTAAWRGTPSTARQGPNAATAARRTAASRSARSWATFPACCAPSWPICPNAITAAARTAPSPSLRSEATSAARALRRSAGPPQSCPSAEVAARRTLASWSRRSTANSSASPFAARAPSAAQARRRSWGEGDAIWAAASSAPQCPPKARNAATDGNVASLCGAATSLALVEADAGRPPPVPREAQLTADNGRLSARPVPRRGAPAESGRLGAAERGESGTAVLAVSRP
mmetsp:Transcript_103963/g.232157  ORF Transcript_103963/g.232157 Transcript_103963/m.232157 type:complete len:307 (-) Transcript_103963:416-1336(-)